MPKITVVKPFGHADDGIHATRYVPGHYEVSERCAEVAIAEGWAVPFVERKPAPAGIQTGEAAPAPSSPPARRYRRSKSAK